MVYGDEKKYLTALITLEETTTRLWAAQQGIDGPSHADLVNHPKVRAYVQAVVDEVNGGLTPFETIKRYHLHDGHLSVDAGEIMPSLNVRRPQVWEAYRERFEALYP